MPEITITSKRDGFRRCGVAHRDVPVTWPDGSFTAEQIAVLRSEPALVVHTGAVSSNNDKLKAALERIDELEAVSLQLSDDAEKLKTQLQASQDALAGMTADRDRLQVALDSALKPATSDKPATAAEGTATTDGESKAKK